jgi:hypothetical protein
VSRFYLDIHEKLMEYLFLDEYYAAHIGEDKYVNDPYAHWLYQVMSRSIFWRYFVKMNYMSPRNVVD